MLVYILLLTIIGPIYGHTWQQYQGLPENVLMIPNGQTVVHQQRCCWVKKCKNQVCQESYACGDSCPAPDMSFMGNMQPMQPGNYPTSMGNYPQPSVNYPQQSGNYPQPANNPVNHPTQPKQTFSCCIVQQCNQNQCQPLFTCGDKCQTTNKPESGQNPELTTPKPSNYPKPPNSQPKSDLNCCIIQQVLTCGPQCATDPKKQPGSNSGQPDKSGQPESLSPDYKQPGNPQKLQNTTPKSAFPARSPNMDYTPQFKPLPGIDNKPHPSTNTSVKPPEAKNNKYNTKPDSNKKCDDKVHFPEDKEDYGPTPGYELKTSYKRNKCDKKGCKMVTVDCAKCPDPFDGQFRLYDVERECFKCYEISCTSQDTPK